MSIPRALVSEPRDDSVRSIGRNGYHRIAYRDWGDPAAPTVFCVHGLSRNSRDFDPLRASTRGQAGGWSARHCRPRPKRLAGRPERLSPDPVQSGHDGAGARVGAESFDWIGTSLGGLMGIVLAGVPNSPIRRLVINDIAP